MLEFTEEFLDFKKPKTKSRQSIVLQKDNAPIQKEEIEFTDRRYLLNENKFKLFKVNLPLHKWISMDGDLILNGNKPYKKCLVGAKTIEEVTSKFGVMLWEIEFIDDMVVL